MSSYSILLMNVATERKDLLEITGQPNFMEHCNLERDEDRHRIRARVLRIRVEAEIAGLHCGLLVLDCCVLPLPGHSVAGQR